MADLKLKGEDKLYVLDDAGAHRQMLEGKLRDLRSQYSMLSLDMETRNRVAKRASAGQLRAKAFNEGANEQVKPQVKQQQANLTQQMEELEISIEVVLEALAALPKSSDDAGG